MDKPLRVGIIGLSAERGWATAAHIPALHTLSDDFELAGVANTSLASARAAAAAFGLPRAFESTAELVASQLRGCLPRGTRLLWEINGTEGDLRITAKAEQMPVINISPLRVEGGRRGEDGFRELEIPSSFCFGLEDAVAARNVAGVYRLMAHDLRHGTRTAPSFDDAVALHKTLSAIEESAEAGKRVRVGG